MRVLAAALRIKKKTPLSRIVGLRSLLLTVPPRPGVPYGTRVRTPWVLISRTEPFPANNESRRSTPVALRNRAPSYGRDHSTARSRRFLGFLAAALVTTTTLVPTPANAAPCTEGENFGATAPPPRAEFVREHLPADAGLATQIEPTETELVEGWDKWNEDFQNHVSVCEAEEAAAAASVVPSASAPLLSSPANPTNLAYEPSGSIESVICSVFGDYCSQAISVAWCESTMNTAAVNGQYLGLFQMGETERATYGHGSDALSQSKAAYAYFVASGYDWSPWECKP
jgi:hypothetical protein